MNGNSAPDPPEASFQFFGLTIIRKTDLLAAAAFTISISTVLVQLYGFARGPALKIFPPDAVYVYFDHFADGTIVTRIAGQISLTNSGDPGASAVLRDVSVAVEAGRLKFTEPWFSFVDITRQGMRLNVTPKSQAHPTVVAGGGAESFLTNFAPALRDCSALQGCDERADYVSDNTFMKALDEAGGSLSLTFSAQTVGSDRLLKTKCHATLGQDAFVVLAENGWFTMRCFEVSE